MDWSILPHNHGNDLIHYLDKIPPESAYPAPAEIFKQLGDPQRLRIFLLLCETEACVINLSWVMRMSSPAISHHLRMLRNAGLISSRRMGKEVHYKARTDCEQVQKIRDIIQEMMSLSRQILGETYADRLSEHTKTEPQMPEA